MPWDLSCRDWEDRLRAGHSLVPTLPLDEVAANRAVEIFNSMRLPDVLGRPALATAGGDWFRDIVRALFGSIDKETGKRRVRELFLLVPKKNSKTTNCAALMMTAVLLNTRPRGDFVFIAPTQEIAKGAFEQAVGMIEANHGADDGYLRHVMDVQSHLKAITFYGEHGRPKISSRDHDFKGRLRIQTFSDKIVTGGKTVAVMVDELHLLGKDPNAMRVIGQIRGNLQPKKEAFLMFVTTQSDDLPAGAFLNELIAARMIRDREVPEGVPVNMLPVLYEFPDEIIESEAWRDPANWPLVNPNVGRSVDVDQLRIDFEKAKIAGEGEVRRFASQHLNIQIGVALKSNAWRGAKYWEKTGDPKLTLDAILERCDVVTIGLDGGGLDDLFGLAVLGREKGSSEDVGKRRWLLWTHAWCHESTLEQRKDIAARLEDLQKCGDLTIVETVGDDVFEIAEIIERIESLGLLPTKNAIGVDSFGYGGVIEELGVRGFDVRPGERTVGISQGWKLNGAIKDAERRLAGKRIVHCAQPMMMWCCGNARVDPKGNAISISKQVSGTAKIDPLMAMFDAAALMALNPEATGGLLDAFLSRPVIGIG